MEDHTTEHLDADEYFAVIPETILFADISSNAVRCFAILQRYANADRQCWPGQGVIAQRMRCSKDTVKRAIAELIAIGAVEVERRYTPSGDPTSNRYTLKMRVGATLHPPPSKFAPTLVARMHPKSEKVKQSKGNRTNNSSSSTDVDADFDQFWSLYPRKIGKGAARKAWATALHTATPDTIIAGLKQYAPTRTGQDPKYTPHPATWLNQQRWEDEPETPHTPGPQTRRQQAIQTMIAIAQTTSPFQLERTNP